MTTAQVVETSVIVNNNSPIQDYLHPDDQTQPTFEIVCIRLWTTFGTFFMILCVASWREIQKWGLYLKKPNFERIHQMESKT